MKSWLLFSHHHLSDAIHVGQQWISTDELTDQVEQLSRRLQQHQVVEQERVAVTSESAWIQLLSLYACSKLGLTCFPLSTKTPEPSQQLLLKQSGISLIIDGDITAQVKRISPPSSVPTELKNITLLISTSGSSGQPKAVMLSHQALTSNALTSNSTLCLTAKDCWLNALPLHHISGISIIIRTALAGAKMILHEGFDANRVWQDIVTKQVSHISLVPTMLEKLLQASSTPPPGTLRVVLIGGAALNPTLANRALAAGWPLWTTYGMSEMASQVATRQLSADDNQTIPLLPGVQAAILSNGNLLSQGCGQLYLKASTMMTGYANEHDKSGIGLDNNNWLITGDIADLDDQRNLRIVGRADDVLVSGGENIHPAEIENFLSSCPGVNRACIIGIDDASWGQKLCAVYSGSYDQSELEQWSRNKLSGIFLPRCYYQVDQLPELVNGKIDRKLVQQKFH